jgi:ornithine cyclodeaminase/alanine dehydrogenase-like protein (mu-crystallin family)
MKILSAAEVDAALDDLVLIDRLDRMFRTGCEMPPRHHHTITAPLGRGSADATLLLMPAWTSGGRVGVKVVTVFPDNGRRSLPSIYGQYLDGETGAPLAMLDGTMLTKRRTACASGLASRYLSRPDAARLAMIGTGALAPHLIRVHCKVRAIREVTIWGRRLQEAQRLAHELSSSLPALLGRSIVVRAVADRQQAVRSADIVSCATLSKSPLVEGAWLGDGQHIDLVGAYTPEMRESDDDAVRRARLHVDTRAGATREAGDIWRSGAAQSRRTTLLPTCSSWRAASGRPHARRWSQHHALQVGRRRARGPRRRRARRRTIGCRLVRAAPSPHTSQEGRLFTE